MPGAKGEMKEKQQRKNISKRKLKKIWASKRKCTEKNYRKRIW